MSLVYPEPHVYVSLADPYSEAPTWVEITQWTQQAQTQWGRQHELQQVEAGTIALTMDDQTGLFSPWNTQSPWTNQLDYADSLFVPGSYAASVGATTTVPNGGLWTLTSASVTTQAPMSGVGIDGGFTLAVAPTYAGNWTLASGASVNGTPVTGGEIYTAVASFQSYYGTGRNCSSGIAWFDGTGTFISATYGMAVTDTSTWQQTSVTAAAPSNAAFASVHARISLPTSPSSGELHLVCRPGITQQYVDPSSLVVVNNTAWGPGGIGMYPGRPTTITGDYTTPSPSGSIEFVSGSSASSSLPVTVAAPAGIVAGNLLVAVCFSADGSAIWDEVSGWDLDSTIAVGSVSAAVQYKVATGSEPANYTFAGTGTSGTVAVLQYSGTDSAVFPPVDNGYLGDVEGPATSLLASGITPSVDGDMWLTVFGTINGATMEVPTSTAATFTERASTVGSGVSLFVFDAPLDNTDTTDEPVSTVSGGGTTTGLTISFALLPSTDEGYTDEAIPGAGIPGSISPGALGGGSGGGSTTTTYDVAYGYIENIIPSITDESDKTATLNSADILKLMANSTINDSFYPGQVLSDGAVLYWRLGDPAATTYAADSTGNGTPGFLNAGGFQFGSTPARISSLSTSLEVAAGTGLGESVIGTGSPVISALVGMGGATAELWMATTTGDDNALAFGITILLGGVTITVAATEITASAGGLPFNSSGTFNVADGAWHHIAVTYNNSLGSVVIYVDSINVGSGVVTGHELPTTYTAANFQLAAFGAAVGVGLSDFAVYPLVLTSETVGLHHYIGAVQPFPDADSGTVIERLLQAANVPSSLMSIETGVSTLAMTVGDTTTSTITPGTTTVMSVIQQVVASEQGLFFQAPDGTVTFWNREYAISATAATTSQATFSNSSGSQYFYLPSGFAPTVDDLDLWNDVPTMSQAAEVAHDVSNAMSISRYGKRSLQGYTGMIYANDDDTVSLGQWLLSAYQNPYPRVRQITLSSSTNEGGNIQPMMSLSLLDLVTTVYNPQDSGSTFDQSGQIEQITHVITPLLWKTTYQLTPYVFGSTFWFTLDDPVLGVLAGAGSSAANRLAF